MFGPRGAGSFIGKLTGGVAAAFMLTSLFLAYMSSSSETGVADKLQALNEEVASEIEEVEIGKKEEAAPETEQAVSESTPDSTDDSAGGAAPAAPAEPAPEAPEAPAEPAPAAPEAPTPKAAE